MHGFPALKRTKEINGFSERAWSVKALTRTKYTKTINVTKGIWMIKGNKGNDEPFFTAKVYHQAKALRGKDFAC